MAVSQGNNVPVFAQPVLFKNPYNNYNNIRNQNIVAPPGTYGSTPGIMVLFILNLGIEKFMNWIKTIYYFNLML